MIDNDRKPRITVVDTAPFVAERQEIIDLVGKSYGLKLHQVSFPPTPNVRFLNHEQTVKSWVKAVLTGENHLSRRPLLGNLPTPWIRYTQTLLAHADGMVLIQSSEEQDSRLIYLMDQLLNAQKPAALIADHQPIFNSPYELGSFNLGNIAFGSNYLLVNNHLPQEQFNYPIATALAHTLRAIQSSKK